MDKILKKIEKTKKEAPEAKHSNRFRKISKSPPKKSTIETFKSDFLISEEITNLK